MKTKTIAGLTAVVLLAACQARQPAAPTATDPVEVNAVAPAPLPDDRTPPSGPRGPIDPKSAEAAGQVLQTYGALLEEEKVSQARKLWGGDGEASGLSEAQFTAAYAKYRDLHAEVGKPGLTDGAAGSIYIEVPFRLYGTLKSGGRFNLVGPMTLKRVNDVDGATPAQLRWHIVSSGLKPRP